MLKRPILNDLGFATYNSGGGFLVLRKNYDAGYYVLITDPELTEVMIIGLYDGDDNIISEGIVVLDSDEAIVALDNTINSVVRSSLGWLN